ncbi:MAG: Gfo/Idh/MocA family protein [Armatimonadota bacterium]
MVRVAITGLAHGHVNAYVNVWQQRPELDIEVVSCWDRQAERAQAFATQFNIPCVAELDEILNDKSIEAVVVASETAFHSELVVKAANAGKVVILQKPMALTLEQADAIVEAVKANNTRFTMAWQMRVDPENLRMKELLATNDFGKILMARRRHCLSTHTWPGFENTWHNSAELNRDIWADDASHPMDMLHWLLGVPASITAEISTIVNPKVKNDNGIAILRYDSGLIAEVVSSFTSVTGENTTEILCEKGMIVQNYGDGPSSGLRPEGGISLKWFLAGEPAWHQENTIRTQGERIPGLAEPLSIWLHGKRDPICTAEDGRDSLRMILACYESTENGCRVKL